jgi:hypothetical protein
MSQDITPVEAKSLQLEIREKPGDTPLRIAGTRKVNGAVWAFAATTQILNPSYLGLNDYALISKDMTGSSEEMIVQDTEASPPDQEISTQETAVIGDAEIANRDRLELLARAYVARKLSPEEDARLAIVTERVRRLIPRATVGDFEQLQRMAEDVRRIESEDIERRTRLGLL